MTPRKTPLSERLASERNRRLNDRHSFRSRMRNLLGVQIKPRLQTAYDAIASEPLHVNVARERIRRLLDFVHDEYARIEREDAAEQERHLDAQEAVERASG